MPAKTRGTGLKKETVSALAYLLGPVTGVVVLLLESDRTVRFHAMQSIVVFGSLTVLQWVLAVTGIFAFFVPLVTLISFILWLVLMYKSLQGEKWEVPFFGEWTNKLLKN